MRLILTFLLAIQTAHFGTVTMAQEAEKLVVPCAIPYYRELDFIVGDWQVYHQSSGKIAGYDKIGRTLKGCAIQQSWASLDDHFSSNYVPFRMNGKSLTAFNGSKWVQMWVDNQAGVQILKGGPDKDRFLLTSDENIGGFEYQLIWKKNEDGTLTNIHQRRQVKQDKTGEWEVLYNWLYVRNINQNLFPGDERQE